MTCCVGMGRFIALGAMGPKIKRVKHFNKNQQCPHKVIVFNWKYFGFLNIKKNKNHLKVYIKNYQKYVGIKISKNS